ncbi:MAG: hypothetical protein M1546_02660 [Chloroflexi bacterium]|nr:hypothetical protein [Chloroflexota bacterium]
MKNTTGIARPSPLQNIMCYAVWFCLAIATIGLALQVRVNLIQQPLPFSGIDFRVVRLISVVSAIVIGFVALIAIIYLEHFLHTGLKKNRFWPRVMRVVIIEAVVLGLSYAANFLILRALLAG